MDAAQPQEVEDYGQRYDQDAGEEEIVVVDKGEAQPRGVRLPDILLPEIPAERRVGVREELRWVGSAAESPYPAATPPRTALELLLLLPALPEWQKPCLIEDGAQRPLHLPVVHQLGRAQAGVVGGEVEALVKDLVHPG